MCIDILQLYLDNLDKGYIAKHNNLHQENLKKTYKWFEWPSIPIQPKHIHRQPQFSSTNFDMYIHF